MVNATRSKKPQRLPVVLTQTEVQTGLVHLDGIHQLMASLLYGAGLRLIECIRLRVEGVDFDYQQLTARDGKGSKDCITRYHGRILYAVISNSKINPMPC